MRRAFSQLVLLTRAEAASGPKHVVMILVDDLGYGDVGYAGAEFPTAAIDALANGGVKLNQSYVMQLCSPTRTSLLTGRYSYNIGTDGNVLNGKDERCADLTVNTIAEVLKEKGAETAVLGKWDNGYSSWACTPTCRGFDYFLGYYGAAQDYYLHGSKKQLDFHHNFQPQPQYIGEYSTIVFTQMAIEWITDTLKKKPDAPTFLLISHQAVHGPLEAPDQYYDKCNFISNSDRKTYCAMVQALDESVANVTKAYQDLGIWGDTLTILLSDNGGMPSEGGTNAPLRGSKASVWEGGVRSQTFVHWPGLASDRVGSTFGGLVHVSDWLPTVHSALFGSSAKAVGKPFDGIDAWAALKDGTASKRTEMLISMRDADSCGKKDTDCVYPGQLAYRSGPYKLIHGHTWLRGGMDDTCASWSKCGNGWVIPPDVGSSRAPNEKKPSPGQPEGTNAYSWGSVWLFDIENDPLEENDLSEAMPDKVNELLAKLSVINATHIDQTTHKDSTANDTESCGRIECVVPWMAPRLSPTTDCGKGRGSCCPAKQSSTLIV